jgi:hypothetical protein
MTKVELAQRKVERKKEASLAAFEAYDEIDKRFRKLEREGFRMYKERDKENAERRERSEQVQLSPTPEMDAHREIHHEMQTELDAAYGISLKAEKAQRRAEIDLGDAELAEYYNV